MGYNIWVYNNSGKEIDFLAQSGNKKYFIQVAYSVAKDLRGYLERLCNSIVVKDIANRRRISNTMMPESIVRFVFDNIGNPLSSKKIADTMTSEG